MARLACIPFSLLGAVVCFCWARELYGAAFGFAALILWCFSPTILGHASTIGPDAHAAACGLFACYVFWHWLQKPSVSQMILAGLALGLAELTKTTWTILFLLWPAIWLFWRVAKKEQIEKPSLGGIFSILLLGILCINIVYGGERILEPLKNYRFISTSLGGPTTETNTKMQSKNRFKNTPLENVPVPLPQNYVLGIDIQRSDFEFKSQNYLLGEWKYGGWLYYYVVAFFVKEPLALTLLLLCSVLLCFRKCYWIDEIILLAPATLVFLLVSSQTGMNQHYRYMIGVLPFLFVFASKTMSAYPKLTATLLAWYVVSSLVIFPHSLSYFNEAIGGPMQGHKYLLGSNLEWGQDVLLLKNWVDKHSDAKPLFVDQASYFDVAATGIETQPMQEDEFVPGWYAIGVNQLYDMKTKYQRFHELEPVARIGYSTYVYHLTEENVGKK